MAETDNRKNLQNIFVFILIALVLILAIFIVGRLVLPSSAVLEGLEMSEWDTYLLVLVRAENDHQFLIKNESEKDFIINNIRYLYSAGPELSIAAVVNKTEVFSGGDLFVFEKNGVYDGDTGFLIKAGEDIEIVSYFYGNKLGINPLNGIRLDFTLDGKEGQIDLITPDTVIDVQ